MSTGRIETPFTERKAEGGADGRENPEFYFRHAVSRITTDTDVGRDSATREGKGRPGLAGKLRPENFA